MTPYNLEETLRRTRRAALQDSSIHSLAVQIMILLEVLVQHEADKEAERQITAARYGVHQDHSR